MSKYLCADCVSKEQCDGEWTTNCASYVPKEYKQTEQEHIQTCTTEQLADVFFEYRYVNATPRQKLWMSANEKCIKTDIVEWLKQPHNEVAE